MCAARPATAPHRLPGRTGRRSSRAGAAPRSRRSLGNPKSQIRTGPNHEGHVSHEEHEFFVVVADSRERRGAVDALAMPTYREAGNRAERFVASTSLPAFSLYRAATDVLCRVTDVATNHFLVDAGPEGHERGPISRHERPQPPRLAARAKSAKKTKRFSCSSWLGRITLPLIPARRGSAS